MGNVDEIQNIVIVGGGTAGWMTAAAVARFLDNGCRKITLVESDDIGTIGVGEATIPPIQNFNGMLGINENEFLAATNGTFKLGIEFVNWGQVGDRYFHPFGTYGHDIHGIPFHQLYLRERAAGRGGDISTYCMSAMAAMHGKFGRPSRTAQTALAELAYAFHFDASLYARFLRNMAENAGVIRREGRIVAVHRNGETGHIASVQLENGQRIEGELFVDCTGFRALLIGETLGVGYEDWSHWLPVNRALAVPTANTGSPAPYTRSTAHGAGWQWRIPLQHRTGNGHVYCSDHMSDDHAAAVLMANLDGEALADPRPIRFTTGRRKKSWSHNVIAVGLSSGFLEPLESTSIHLIQVGISRLLALLPDRRFLKAEMDEYNDGAKNLYEDIRDFIILHYKATQRNDTPFWNRVRTMDVPESLKRKMALFQSRGRVFRDGAELFAVPSWVAVMFGQNIWPDRYDGIVDSLDEMKVAQAIAQMRDSYARVIPDMPTQEAFLRAAGAWAAGHAREPLAVRA